jgi:secreted PhoX family phosphatase
MGSVHRVSRRSFLRGALATAALGTPRDGLGRGAAAERLGYGPLRAPDDLGLMLPGGFRARVLARAGRRVTGTDHEWHVFPDGGATFAFDDGSWAYVSNSEALTPGDGGASAIRFARDGSVSDAYPVLSGTLKNCAGGPTPWGTWLSCEEHDRGQVHECDPAGVRPATVLPALGTFSHEAAAVDAVRGHVYLTEDQPDGRLYRFTPDVAIELASGGVLEVAKVDGDGRVAWATVPDPAAAGQPTRAQVVDSTPFAGGEGAWYHDGHVVFVTKLDQRIWDLDAEAQRLRVLHDARAAPAPAVLDGPDNLVVSSAGDLYVCEDHADGQELVVVAPDGSAAAPVLRVTGQPGTELAGAAFDPSGTRLYVSSQRGGGTGVTYEVEGPWRHAPPTTTTRAPRTAVSDDGGGSDPSIVPLVGGLGGAVALAGALWWLRSRRAAPHHATTGTSDPPDGAD